MSQKIVKNNKYPKVRLKDVLAIFWRGIKPQKWLFLTIILVSIVAPAISTFVPVFYKKFFDTIFVSGNPEATSKILILIILQILGLQGISWICYRIGSFGTVYFESWSIARLKLQAYDYLMEHSYGFFVDNFAGSLVQKINRFARAFEQLIDRIIWDILLLFTRLFFIFAVLFFYNPMIAWLVLAWVIFFLVSNFWFATWKLKYDIAAAETDSKTTGFLADTIANHSVIHLFSAKKMEAEGFKNLANEQAKKYALSWNLSTLFDAIQSGLNIVLQFALFFFAIIFWTKGAISVGVFVMLQSYIFIIIDNTFGFSRVIKGIYQSYADAKEMAEILLLPHEILDSKIAKNLTIKNGEIKFKDLNFNFNETRKVLDNINLEIKPGEKVALVGPSGAGKTTFVRLLLRLYSPTSGQILIDGQDISEVAQESLRKNVSLVPQDTILFHRTLSKNIAYGKQDATKEEIEEAARLAHCDDFIKNLPLGLETYVGERGIKLSGGERQRVAIARAILKNSPILILDEATSSLDSNSEMLIQDALNTLMKGKTTIVIAHRLSTIQKMDRIIVVDGGKIVEQGSHNNLLKKKNSLYRKLWELQAGGFLKEEDEELKAIDEELENDEKDGGQKDDAKLINF